MEFTPSNTSPLWEEEHLSKDALVRWRNHTLSPAQIVEASEHLAVCEKCRDQLAAPKALLLLAQALDNGQDELAFLREPELQHPNFEQMEAFVDELMTPAGRRNVERHLALCQVCSAQVADLRAVQRDLRDWQTSSHIVPEVVAPASTTANGAAPYSIAASERTSTPVGPPMRVALPVTNGEKSRRSWWEMLRNMQRYLLPLETAGVAAAAVFLLLIGPSRQKLVDISAKYDDMARQKELADAALTRGQDQNRRSDAQIKQLKNRMASFSQQGATAQQKIQQLEAALASQSNDTQSQLSATQSKLEEAKSQLSALEEQHRRDLEDFAGRPSVGSSPVAPSPTSPSSGSHSGVQTFSDGPGAHIVIQNGHAVRVPNPQALSDDASRVLKDGLQDPPSVKALRALAPTSKSADTQFHFRLLSPVATRIRDVRPLLRWEAVPRANVYRVTLADETDLGAPLLKSDLLTKSQWQPEEPLIRGHRYSWTVQAWKKDQNTGKLHVLADAPHKPDLAANFELLTQAQEDALQAHLGTVNDSPFERSRALAKAGVMDEARQQLSLVTRLKAPPSLQSP